MKKSKLNISSFTLLMALLVFTPISSMAEITTPCGIPAVKTLLAGQTIDAGTVTVANDVDQLCVTYQTEDGWMLAETHLHIAWTLADIPQNKKGNPQPGHFAYGESYDPLAPSDEFCFNLAELLGGLVPGDTIYIAASASLVKLDDAGNTVQQEGAWAEGTDFPGGNWAMYFTYEIQECQSQSSELQCETAFAYGGGLATCFLDLGFSRWGWSNGPLGEGTYTFDIWAAAGQCDTSKGVLVGTLTVEYYSGTAAVTYTMYEGFTLDETHLYVGNEILPRDVKGNYTVAPGQYPYKDGASATYTVEGLSGDIYVVAHAVVCKTISQAPSMSAKPRGLANLWGKIKNGY